MAQPINENIIFQIVLFRSEGSFKQWGSECEISSVFEWSKNVRSVNGPLFRSPLESQTKFSW